MWARVVEMMTAVWLLLSPFIFGAQDSAVILWGDTLVALLIATLSGASYWPPLRHAHFAILAVAIGLLLVGRFTTTPPVSPAQQNHIFIGFFLLMVAIVPNEASRPPLCWRQPIQDA